MITQKNLFMLVRSIGVTIGKDESGDYRLSVPPHRIGGQEAARLATYFTSDRIDALLSACNISRYYALGGEAQRQTIERIAAQAVKGQ